MGYKSILVQAVGEPSGLHPVQAAVSAARLFDATLVGVGAAALDAFLEPAVPYMDAPVRRALQAEIETNLRRAEAMFHGLAGGPSDKAIWKTAAQRPLDAVTRFAAGADLVVAGRSDGGDPAATAPLGPLVMAAGLPVLVAPPALDTLTAESVVVGWKNTGETRRALSGALPFLKRARRVLVVGAVESALDTDVAAELEDVALRLSRHGVRAAVEMRADAADPGRMLVDAAEREGADLIVAGAYGHSRLREWMFGGVTRSLLREAPVFVLFGR